MQLAAVEDIEAPVHYVFDQLSDFAALQRSALRRGFDVQRTDRLAGNALGMTWIASYELRQTRLSLGLELTKFDAPHMLVVEGDSKTLGGVMTLDLVALSRGRTRVKLDVDVQARTLTTRLLIQSFRLARVHPSITVKNKLNDYARRIEQRYKSAS